MTSWWNRRSEDELANDEDLAALLARCHLRFVGRPLPGPPAAARWLYYQAPFGLVVLNADPDPSFVYANRTAQDCGGYDWTELLGMPAQFVTEPTRREDRQRLHDEADENGSVTGRRGVRLTRYGRRFWIEDLTIWNLVNRNDIRLGQASAFRPA
jgi:PAS domain S-box-containing protein